MTWRICLKRKWTKKVFMGNSVLLCLIICLSLLAPSVPADQNVLSVRHSSEAPSSGESVTVFTELADTSNVSWVRLIYCTIDPYACQLPVDMNSSDGRVYTGEIKGYGEGEQIGYSITIRYTDNHTEKYPKGMQDGDNIIEPIQGAFYYSYTVSGEYADGADESCDSGFFLTCTTRTGLLIQLSVAGAFIALAALYYYKKGKLRREGKEKEGK